MVYGAPSRQQRPAPTVTPPKSSAERWANQDATQFMRKTDPIGTGLGLWGKKQKVARHLWEDPDRGVESVLQQFEQGGSSADAIQSLLTNFKGSEEDLADLMEIVGPMMGGLESRRLEQSPGLDYMSDQGNWDMGAMGSYGAAAGQMGAGTRRAITESQQGLAASGLGRGSGSNAITAMLRQQNASAQGGLRSQLEQQSARNRMSSANTLFDAHRTIAQLALGQQITPRITSPQDANQGIGGVGQGAAAGGTLGASIGGPWGALIGAGVGAGYGAYSQNKSK